MRGDSVAERVTALSAAFTASPVSKRFLIFGSSRAEIASALVEYRAFVAANPSEELTPFLRDTMRDIHTALHQEREVQRAIGWGEKPCARNRDRRVAS